MLERISQASVKTSQSDAWLIIFSGSRRAILIYRTSGYTLKGDPFINESLLYLLYRHCGERLSTAEKVVGDPIACLWVSHEFAD